MALGGLGQPLARAAARVAHLFLAQMVMSPVTGAGVRNRISTMVNCTVLVLVIAAMAIPVAAPAQQRDMRVVSVLSQDRGMVDSTVVATKDIASHLASQHTPQARRPMIIIRNCEKVPPDTIRTLAQDLEKGNFIVVLDSNRPDARLCAS
jgi:hypothetical protein